MKRQSIILLGMSLLLAGWFSAFLLNSVPQYRTLYIIFPTLLLGTGMGVVLKVVGGKLTALTVALTALTALLTLNQLFPASGISISAFQSRWQENGSQLRTLPINVKGADQTDLFSTQRSLDAFADIDISLFSRLPASPAMMAFGEDGYLYVSLPYLGAIYRLKDGTDGFADTLELFSAGLDRPTGLAWADGDLYVAEPSQVLVLSDADSNGQADQVKVLVDDLPDDGGHWRRTLIVSGDQLFLSIGSRCNACGETNDLRASIQKIDLRTGHLQAYAKGLRNVSSMSLDEQSKLWGVDLSTEGDAGYNFPDEINQITSGGDFGWPHCYGSKQSDPQFGSNDLCQDTIASQFELPSESDPMGFTFGHKLNAPESYRNSVYVSLNGQLKGNSSRLMRIAYDGNQLASHGKEFLRGWESDSSRWGQPGALAVDPKGDLYLSDEISKAIYKIHWTKEKNN